MNRCEDATDRECISQKVRPTTNFEGLLGNISIGPDGKAQRPLVINAIYDPKLDVLHQMYEQMGKCLVARDIKGYYRVNEDFHEQLFNATGNEVLITIETAVEQMGRAIKNLCKTPGVYEPKEPL